MDRPQRGLNALSPTQLRALAEASTILERQARAAFVGEVATALRDKGPVVGDGDLYRAVQRALHDHRDERRVR
jgi:hypothetical protein